MHSRRAVASAAPKETGDQETMSFVDVTGWCPMGCGRTLHLNSESGMIACLNKACPSPLAVTKLISADRPFHLVKISRKDFSVEHPLKERAIGSLFDCSLVTWLEALDRAPVSAGFYRVSEVDPSITDLSEDEVTLDGWSFRKEPEQS
jgi:hypothetical protein